MDDGDLAVISYLKMEIKIFSESAEIRNQDEQVMGSGTSWDKQHLSLTQLTSTDSMAATP